jgi:apolipoprotein D and lipocalin family protein
MNIKGLVKIKKRVDLLVCVLLMLSVTGAVRAEKKSPLRVVPSVDLDRYAGQWYEIARLPNRFQKKCAGEVIANYERKPDGDITVLNSCRLEDGSSIQAQGVARLAGKGQTNSVLKVRFAPAFLSFIPQVWGDYQIISLSSDYTRALVGDPGREYLWILSRSPRMDSATYDGLIAEANAQGFDAHMLQKTRQSGS